MTDDLSIDDSYEIKAKYSLDVVIDTPLWMDKLDFDVIEKARLAHQITFDYLAMMEEHYLLALDKNFEMNLCLSDNGEVHRLNKEFRGMDKPTNVLSFANMDDDDFEDILANHYDIELGDIIIAFETIQEEALAKKISFEDHYTHILVHGFLHLFGYDHIEEEDAIFMEEIEANILSVMEIDDPYENDEIDD